MNCSCRQIQTMRLVEPLESEIQADIIKSLCTFCCEVYRTNSGQVKNNVKMFPAGTPDLLILTPHGHTWWCEVKRPGRKPTEVQKNRHQKLRTMGQLVTIAHSADEAINQLWKIEDGDYDNTYSGNQ